jgi:4-hydroxybenzoate octaprenyltransferase
MIFIFGVIFMRAAGCVINDSADRNIDGQVKRTLNRPLAIGRVMPKEASCLLHCLLVRWFWCYF